MEFLDLLAVSLAGGVFVLDVSAVGQFMISRPVVVAPVIGAMMGEPGLGLAVGVLVNLLWMHTLPIGGALPPNVTVLAILATTWAATAGCFRLDAVVLSLLVAWPFAVLFRQSDFVMRRFLSHLNHRLDDQASRGMSLRLNQYVAMGVALAFLKGSLFILGAGWVGFLLVSGGLRQLPGTVLRGLAMAHPALVILGLSMAMHAFFTRR